MLKKYQVGPGKIEVVRHGYEDLDLKLNVEDSKLDLPKKYVLFLSTLQPRKNLEKLVDAFVSLKRENPELPHKLVVVGKPGWKYESILRKLQESQEYIVYLNHVTDRQRLDVLKGADLLVLPSFYEGFGMQILESFAAGVPVATSNVSSMPEVAGEAAVYFDPKNVQEMKSSMKAVLLDKSFAESLREKGNARLKEFSWQKSARETLNIFSKLNES